MGNHPVFALGPASQKIILRFVVGVWRLAPTTGTPRAWESVDMAKVWLTEYQYAARDGASNSVAMPLEPSLAVQPLDITNGAQTSAVLNTLTSFVVLTGDGPFAYQVGAAPAADPTTCTRIASGISFGVKPGLSTKISVVQG